MMKRWQMIGVNNVPMEYNLLIVGALLMLVELAIPGFGIFGVLGLASLTLGSFFVLGGGMEAFLILLAIYAVIIAIILVICFYFPSKSKWNPFVLWDEQKNSAGYTGSSDFSSLLNKKGKALTPLRPAGTVDIDGERIDVSSLGDYIDKDELVEIVKIEGSKLFVKRIS